jgi:hypothetical protein
MKAKVHRCKAHQYSHRYTLCTCGCQYCARVWASCPRCAERTRAYSWSAYSWHNGVHPAPARKVEPK